MKKIYSFLAITLLSTSGFAQLKQAGNNLSIHPQFKADHTYTYELILKKLVQENEEVTTEVEQIIPIELKLYSEGEGFNLFEWKSAPMLFFRDKTAEEEAFVFSQKPITIQYRTDENYVLGEVSNYDEVIQDYNKAFQELYRDADTDYSDLASKSSLYFVQMFHSFFGQEFSTKNKEQMVNLFYNPMRNSFAAAEDEITYQSVENGAQFNFKQKFNMEMEDNSAKMMNHKTVDSYRSKQTGADYSLKSWGNQVYQSNGLVEQIERVTEVKQNGKIIQFIYTLSKK